MKNNNQVQQVTSPEDDRWALHQEYLKQNERAWKAQVMLETGCTEEWYNDGWVNPDNRKEVEGECTLLDIGKDFYGELEKLVCKHIDAKGSRTSPSAGVDAISVCYYLSRGVRDMTARLSLGAQLSQYWPSGDEAQIFRALDSPKMQRKAQHALDIACESVKPLRKLLKRLGCDYNSLPLPDEARRMSPEQMRKETEKMRAAAEKFEQERSSGKKAEEFERMRRSRKEVHPVQKL